MSHKVLIGGTAYEVKGGRTLIDGTGYDLASGKALVDGTAYDVKFGAQPLVLYDGANGGMQVGSLVRGYRAYDGSTAPWGSFQSSNNFVTADYGDHLFLSAYELATGVYWVGTIRIEGLEAYSNAGYTALEVETSQGTPVSTVNLESGYVEVRKKLPGSTDVAITKITLV